MILTICILSLIGIIVLESYRTFWHCHVMMITHGRYYGLSQWNRQQKERWKWHKEDDEYYQEIKGLISEDPYLSEYEMKNKARYIMYNVHKKEFEYKPKWIKGLPKVCQWIFWKDVEWTWEDEEYCFEYK